MNTSMQDPDELSAPSAVQQEELDYLLKKELQRYDVFRDTDCSPAVSPSSAQGTDESQQIAINACISNMEGWGMLSPADCSIKPITGGCTNIIYLVELQPDVVAASAAVRQAVVRQFGAGTEDFINRDQEALIYQVFATLGAGPRIWGHFDGGRVEEFFPSTMLTCGSLKSDKNMGKIASMIGKIHKCEDDGTISGKDRATSRIISDLRSWAEKAARVQFPHDPAKQEALNNLRMGGLLAEMRVLIDALMIIDSKIVLCHNDLHEGNILQNEQGKMLLIDFEYAGWGPRGYDLGNHFCEMSVDNFANGDLGFKYSSSAYPSKIEQYGFFRTYLEAFSGEMSAEQMEQEMDKLYKEVNIYALLSHFKWALWGIASSESSDVEFAFLEFAQARLSAYYEWKAKWYRKELWPKPDDGMAGALAAAEAEAAAANKQVFSYEKELLKWQRTALVTILGLLFLGFRYRRSSPFHLGISKTSVGVIIASLLALIKFRGSFSNKKIIPSAVRREFNPADLKSLIQKRDSPFNSE